MTAPAILRRYARPALVALLVAACVWALVASWDDVTDALPRVGVARFVARHRRCDRSPGSLSAVGWRILLVDMSAPRAGSARSSRSPCSRPANSASTSPAACGRSWPRCRWPAATASLDAPSWPPSSPSCCSSSSSAVVVAAATLPWVDSDELRARWWLLAVRPARRRPARAAGAAVAARRRRPDRSSATSTCAFPAAGRSSPPSPCRWRPTSCSASTSRCSAGRCRRRPTCRVLVQSIGAFALAGPSASWSCSPRPASACARSCSR